MPRTSEHEELQKHTLLLYAGDFERLGSYYPEVGATVMVRRIVRKYLERIDGAAAQPKVEVELKL